MAIKELRNIEARHKVTDTLGILNRLNTLPTLNLPLNSKVHVQYKHKGSTKHRGQTRLYILLAIKRETYIVNINSTYKFRTIVIKLYYQDSKEDKDYNRDSQGDYIKVLVKDMIPLLE